jgi:prepilin-type N-terminal cleavage/methylation domain-containing protein
MRRMSPTPARAGMTLIELLVVMLIIATLASLILSAVFTVRDSQMKSFSETLVLKLSSALEQQQKAAIDQIREEPVPNWALTMAGGDPRIAKVIYLKTRVKQEFPVSFYQAVYPNANYTPMQTGAYQTIGGAADLPPKATYLKALQPLVGTAIPAMGQSIPNPDQYPSLSLTMPAGFEASALLYLALSQGRRGQTGFNPDESIEPTAIKTATVGGATFKYFVDSWGNPVRSWMFPYGNNELNDSTLPYNKNALPQNQQSPDPQDPDQAFATFTGASYPGSTGFTRMVHPTVPLRLLIPVVGSMGRDGSWGMANYFDMTPDGTPGMNDNIFSYRLRRLGQRGD